MRNFVRLAVLLLVAHALYRFVPVYLHYQQFKDAVAETVLFARDRKEPELLDRVMALAEQYRIPIGREDVAITRDGQATVIAVSYRERIEWLPTYRRPMTFRVSARGWHAPPTPGASR